MGLGNVTKAIWTLVNGITSPDVVASYNALVASGNIRYVAFPAAVAPVPCGVGVWAEIYTAANSPAVPHWLVGFQIGFATGIAVEQSFRIDLGYGGNDGVAVAAGIVLVTDWPIHISAAGAGVVGTVSNQILPYPILIPVDQADPGSRMAYSVVDNPVGAAVGATSCRVLLATAIGT